ncbi:MAG: DUF4330 domain-containing protein [Cyanophyceae cyanobacterium]
MKILDSKGRLFGKVSVLDLGAACVIALAIVGIVFFPGTSGSIAQQVSGNRPVEVDVLVRGLSVREPQALLNQLQEEKTASIVIRNQPAGQIEVVAAEVLPRTVSVPQPDGSVKALPDPRPEVAFVTDMIVKIVGDGQITSNGAVLGNQKVKIGSVIEIDGSDYNFRGSVMDVSSGS